MTIDLGLMYSIPQWLPWQQLITTGFLYHPYILSFLIQRIFHFLITFLCPWSWPIMPVHLKIPICTFTFSDNPLLTPQDDS